MAQLKNGRSASRISSPALSLVAALLISVLGAFSADCGYLGNQSYLGTNGPVNFNHTWNWRSLLVTDGDETRCVDYKAGNGCILYSKSAPDVSPPEIQQVEGSCRSQWILDDQNGDTVRLFFSATGQDEELVAAVSVATKLYGDELSLVDRDDAGKSIEVVPDDRIYETDECVTALSK